MKKHRRTRQPFKLNSSQPIQLGQKKPRAVNVLKGGESSGSNALCLVSSSPLLRLLRRDSLLFWCGILVFLFIIAAIAVFSITHISFVEQTGGATPITISTQKPNSSAQTYSHIAVGLLGALIFVTVSVTFGKYLNRASRSYRIRQRTRRSAASELRHRREQRQQFETDRLSREIAQADISISSPSFSTQNSSNESLAEMMDIRKRLSLESILQKTK